MTKRADLIAFKETGRGRVIESHLGKLPEPDTLCVYMTRGEHRVRESICKTFGSIRYVVIDVDGEQHKYDADALIGLLEGFEVEQ